MNNNAEINGENIMHILKLSDRALFNVEITPDNFILPNRAGYSKYVDLTFMREYSTENEGKGNKLFHHQKFVKDYMQFASPYRGLLLYHLLGSGKCFAWDTPILMFDGSIKKVQDIIVNDKIMGDDSMCRNVLSLGGGRDIMYDIIQFNGEKYTVNSEHILCLKNIKLNEIINISVKNYLNLSDDQKKNLVGYRQSVSFQSKKVKFNPYTKGLRLFTYIPNNYKINDCDIRLQVLAGIIDNNGHYNGDYYKIYSDIKRMSDDIIFLGRSLGYAAQLCKNYVSIWGNDLEKIPVKIISNKVVINNNYNDVLISNINVREVGENSYYGFTLDGNHKFLLGDFTVTHNTSTSIAAAEILLNKKDVCVLLPASLQENFINEIKIFGNNYYKKEQYWVFVKIDKIKDKLKEITNYLKINIDIIRKYLGLWVPYNLKGLPSNFGNLEKTEQEQINVQINDIIKNRYHFIRYNGLKYEDFKKKIPESFFNDKYIIVDEIHNLISRIKNKTKIGLTLNRMLFHSKNSKILFLSGTPIINEPYELSIMINLLTGPREKYTIRLKKSLDKDDLNKILSNNKYIDQYSFYDTTANNNGIEFRLLPEGFKFIDENNLRIKRDDLLMLQNSKILNDIFESIKKYDPTAIRNIPCNTLPDKKKEFNTHFIDFVGEKIKNPQLLMRRILGCISYYNYTPHNLFPKFSDPQIISLEMSEHQYQAYVKSREQENKIEKYSLKNPNDKTFGRLYRFYSRACCNFVFPKDIARPKPPQKKKTRVDLDKNSYEYDSDTSDTNDNEVISYKKEIELSKDLLAKPESKYLCMGNELKTHSPKFNEIIQKINELSGTALIYSQFKVLEGIDILAISLIKNGYKKFNLSKKNGLWNIDDILIDNKPAFMILNPKDEESKILLKLYNNDFTDLPDNIKNNLKNKNNLLGNIIKIALITQSGAEGISLKNVRQVHILEPYWNKIRIDQVIGRAIRTRSHIDLPPHDRRVDIFIYSMTFSKSQKKRRLKESDTTDEHIYNAAMEKSKINDQILNLMKQASVDCVINAKLHNMNNKEKDPKSKKIVCYSNPINMPDNEIINLHDDLNYEYNDSQYLSRIKPENFKGKVVNSKKGKFIIDPQNNKAYHYDIYKETGKLDCVGTYGNGKIITDY